MCIYLPFTIIELLSLVSFLNALNALLPLTRTNIAKSPILLLIGAYFLVFKYFLNTLKPLFKYLIIECGNNYRKFINIDLRIQLGIQLGIQNIIKKNR